MASVSPDALQCPKVWQPVSTTVPPPANDNYPFLYLKDRTIPAFYLLTLALILLAALALVRITAGTLRPMGRYLDLFCMGAAFLLLETKNVVQFALLFGTTWFVNSLVFLGILIAVYLAIETARRIELGPSWRLYAALILALALAWVVQPDLLLGLSVVPRFLVAVAIVIVVSIVIGWICFKFRLKEFYFAVVTLAGVHSGTLIGGAVITETVFAWPGIGRLMYEALLQRDYNLLLGVFVVCSAMVLIFNLITDLVYRLVDPRIEFAS